MPDLHQHDAQRMTLTVAERILAAGPFDIAVWDFDGVIADTEPVQRDTCLEMLRARNIHPAQSFFGACIGRTEGEIWALLADTHDLPESGETLKTERAAILDLALRCLEPSAVALLFLPVFRAAGARQVIVSSGNVEVIEALLVRWSLRGYFGGADFRVGLYQSPQRARGRVVILSAI